MFVTKFKQSIALTLALYAAAFANLNAQTTALCEFDGAIHLECDYTEMLGAIRLYEDTLSSLTEEEIFGEYWTIAHLENGRVSMTYNCDSLYLETLQLIALIEAARTPPIPPGSIDPCSNFNSVIYYGTTYLMDGGATGERDFLDYCWFRSNLQTPAFENGDTIPVLSDPAAWSASTGPAFALYKDSVAVLDVFGYHYNTYAVADPRKLCPPGMTLPDSTVLENLQTWAAANDQLFYAQRRLSDGTWAPFESIHVGDGNYEDQPTTQFYALDFTGDQIADSLVYFSNPSAFNIANNVASNLLAVNAGDGMSARCRKMTLPEIRLDDRFLEWVASAPDTAYDAPSYYQMVPRVHAVEANNIAATTGAIRGNMYWTGDRAATAVGFKWSTSPNLSGADSVTAATNAYSPADNSTSHKEALAGLFSYDLSGLTTGVPVYYTPWVTGMPSGTLTPYSFGDTLSFTPAAPPFTCTGGTIDYDGYTYSTVQIGDQCWFQQNLRNDNFNDGASIAGGLDNTAWSSATTPAYSIYDEGGEGESGNLAAYGRIYNGFAVQTGKLCPSGWHVGTETDWTTLINFIGDEASAGTALKSTEVENPGWNGSNSSGFSALPGGMRSGSPGSFNLIGTNAYMWTSSTIDGTDPVEAKFMTFNSDATVPTSNAALRTGMYARCIQNSVASLTTDSVSALNWERASLHGTMSTSGGSDWTAFGFIWGTAPDLSDATSTAVALNGQALQLDLTGLTPSTSYYFTAFATNSTDTLTGDTLGFMTSNPPLLITEMVIDETETTATLEGTVDPSKAAGPITEVGFIWSQKSDFSTADTLVASTLADQFNEGLTGLDEGTTYYYIAYAIDDNGMNFGDTLSFRTGLFCSETTLQACGQETIVYHDVEYNLVGIGDQCWFRDNLRSRKYTDGSPIEYDLWYNWFAPTKEEGGVAYYGENYPGMEDYNGYNSLYGGEAYFGLLYDGFAVENPKGLCPTGWHVPRRAEFDTLAANLPLNVNSNPDYGSIFDLHEEDVCFRMVKPGQFVEPDLGNAVFTNLDNLAVYMTIDMTPPPFKHYLTGWYEWTHTHYAQKRINAGPIRCIKGEYVPEEVFYCGYSEVDYNGYSYSTTPINGECWFAENLRTDAYTNGDPISTGLSQAAWLATTSGAQTAYNDDESNVSAYGRLYNHYAIDDERGICPSGWHVSTKTEWEAMIAATGGMGSASIVHRATTAGGANSFGFSSLLSGVRQDFGPFQLMGVGAMYWMSDPSLRYVFGLLNTDMAGVSAPRNASFGGSVRCVQDAAE